MSQSSLSHRIAVAFVGKGGSGKSTVAGTLARVLGRSGLDVLAVDSDPLPGLAYSLGIEIDDRPIPDDVVIPGPASGPRWILRPDLEPADFVEFYSARGPDGVRYLQFGNLRGHVSTIQRAQQAWSQVVRELTPLAFHVVGDLAGGTRQAMFGWGRYADVACLVVEPTAKSVLTAKRLLNLNEAEWGPREIVVVANKVSHQDDADRIERRLRRAVAVSLPADAEVARADRRGIAPMDAAPEGSFVTAVLRLAETIADLYRLDRTGFVTLPAKTLL